MAAVRAIVALCLVFLGCHRPARLTTETHRIVSLSPSTTETLAAIGARDELVGRARYCDYPPDVASLPAVGGFVDPNFEAIVALRPDLVPGARGPAGRQIAARLERLGIATYFPETESLEGIDKMILGLGDRTNHDVTARHLVADIHAHETGIRERVETLSPRRTLLVFGLAPVVVAGPGSFPDEMLRLAGASNVVTEGGTYPTLGMERLLALAPEVILDASMQGTLGAERIAKDAPGWRELVAVKEGRVVAVRDESVLRPGPRVADGIAALARAVHPGLELP